MPKIKQYNKMYVYDAILNISINSTYCYWMRIMKPPYCMLFAIKDAIKCSIFFRHQNQAHEKGQHTNGGIAILPLHDRNVMASYSLCSANYFSFSFSFLLSLILFSTLFHSLFSLLAYAGHVTVMCVVSCNLLLYTWSEGYYILITITHVITYNNNN